MVSAVRDRMTFFPAGYTWQHAGRRIMANSLCNPSKIHIFRYRQPIYSAMEPSRGKFRTCSCIRATDSALALLGTNFRIQTKLIIASVRIGKGKITFYRIPLRKIFSAITATRGLFLVSGIPFLQDHLRGFFCHVNPPDSIAPYRRTWSVRKQICVYCPRYATALTVSCNFPVALAVKGF